MPSLTVDSEAFGQTCSSSLPRWKILRTGIHAEMLVQFLAFAFVFFAGEPFVISS
jgi:hypothetical protein